MAVSQHNLLHLQQTFATRQEEIGVLHNGIDIRPATATDQKGSFCAATFAANSGCLDDARLLLTTSRLDQQKGHSDLLKKSCLRSSADFPKSALCGPETGRSVRDFESEIHQHNLQEHVRLLGYRTDIERLLDASDLFLFPTHFEGGCSSSIREAMVHKIPIVSSDAGGIPEVLVDGSHALLFPVQDMAGMRAKVNEALASPNRMRSLAERARIRIEDFSAERMVQKYLAC